MPEDRIEIVLEGRVFPFFNCDLEITDFSVTDAIRFKLVADHQETLLELRVSDNGAAFSQTSGSPLVIRRGAKRKERFLIDIFQEDPPQIYFADGDGLIGADLLELSRDENFTPYDPAKIEAFDWNGVDIKVESQGPEKRQGTVQRRIIDWLRSNDTPYDIIFDDDGAGEVADVVAIRQSGRSLLIELFHCKYSAGALPGARVQDLYEVNGQAQKSVRWAEHSAELLQHLRRREDLRQAAGSSTRFESGSMNDLIRLIGQSRELYADFKVYLVQPGLSRAKVTKSQLELFAATESYLMETWRIPMQVLASA